MCKTLARRMIDTAHNFTNKPVFFACDGVQIRRRVSYKVGTKESDRTAQNSRTPRAPERKFCRWQHGRRRACLMIGGKRGGEWCTAWGGGEGRSRSGRQAGTTRRKSSAWRSGVVVQLFARAYIYY